MTTSKEHQGQHHRHPDQGHGHDDHQDAVASATDPVCGMKVDPHTTKHRTEHAGRTYYFCSAKCGEKLVADPARYMTPSKQPAPAAPSGTIYTCPMHPHIRQVGPGNCPICGMALEPEQANLEEGPSQELVDMRRRFWIGTVLTVPVAALEMGGHMLGLDHLVDQQASNWIQFAL